MNLRLLDLLVPIAALLAAGPLAGCSGGDFKSQESPDSAVGTDAGDAAVDGIDGADGLDDGGDGAVDPCAPDPGAAKFCVDVELEAKRPPYGPKSGAELLDIDGNGRVIVWLYDKDPGATDGVKPIATREYPEKSGVEVATAALPVTLTGTADPGTYWVVAAFRDNKSVTRGDGPSFLPGDFILAPARSTDMKLVFPKVTLTKGTTFKGPPLKLKPYRAVWFEFFASSDLRTTYPSGAHKIQGDGWPVYLIYDGALSSGVASGVDIAFGNCVKLDPYGPTPPVIKGSFATTVENTHNFLVGVTDYVETGTKVFPPRGMIYSIESSITIDPNQWYGLVTPTPVALKTVADPYKLIESTPKDATCP